MEKHLLLTIGDDSSGLFAVRFAGSFLATVPDVKLTVLYVTPKPPEVYFDDKNVVDLKESAEKLLKSYTGKADEVLGHAREKLLEYGFPAGNLFTKVQGTLFGTPQDIIQEATKGLYDAVVLGRRGLSRFEEILFKSVSRGVLFEKIDFPLWLCKRPLVGWKDVLLAVDDSEPSMRAIDHVGFILSGVSDRKVTLFHSGEAGRAGRVFETARTMLREAGVPQEIVVEKTASGDYAKAILKEVDEGSYAAVAVGKNPAGASGSTAEKLYEKLEKTSLWVC